MDVVVGIGKIALGGVFLAFGLLVAGLLLVTGAQIVQFFFRHGVKAWAEPTASSLRKHLLWLGIVALIGSVFVTDWDLVLGVRVAFALVAVLGTTSVTGYVWAALQQQPRDFDPEPLGLQPPVAGLLDADPRVRAAAFGAVISGPLSRTFVRDLQALMERPTVAGAHAAALLRATATRLTPEQLVTFRASASETVRFWTHFALKPSRTPPMGGMRFLDDVGGPLRELVQLSAATEWAKSLLRLRERNLRELSVSTGIPLARLHAAARLGIKRAE